MVAEEMGALLQSDVGRGGEGKRAGSVAVSVGAPEADLRSSGSEFCGS